MKLRKVVLFITIGMLVLNLLACSHKNITSKKNNERRFRFLS